MVARILHRCKKANEWAALSPSPILGEGELGIESDTGLVKIGDGEKDWNQLEYSKDSGLQSFVQAYGYIPKTSENKGHRGYFARVYTGLQGKQTDRAFMFLNKTVNGETICELVPISIFSEIRDQVEITDQ